MSEQGKENLLSAAPGGSETEKELYSETKADFIEDLECLYVRGNQGGRLMFAQKWPQIAEKIFPQQLVNYDHEGLQDEEDKEKRDALEIEAEAKRDEIFGYFDGMEQELVVYGSLQLPALEKIMNQIDRTLAEIVFAERFVDKYFPKAPDADSNVQANDLQATTEDEVPQEQATEASAEPVEQNEGQSDAPSDEMHAEPQETPKPINKESIVIPDTEVSSIGHVDHSYNASTPNYDTPKVDGDVGGEGEDDASWLDMPEDEFDDVMPISTDLPEAQNTEEPATQSRPMGLAAHQGQNTDTAPSESMPPSEHDDEEDKPLFVADQDARMEDKPSAPPPLPGAEPQTAPMTPDMPSSAPPPPTSEPASSVPPPSAPPPSSNSGMGLRAHQETNQPNEPSNPSPAPPSEGQASTDAPPLPGAQGEHAPEEKPALRKPSLDDVDNHLGGGSKPSGPPPLPGKEDDRSGF